MSWHSLNTLAIYTIPVAITIITSNHQLATVTITSVLVLHALHECYSEDARNYETDH